MATRSWEDVELSILEEVVGAHQETREAPDTDALAERTSLDEARVVGAVRALLLSEHVEALDASTMGGQILRHDSWCSSRTRKPHGSFAPEHGEPQPWRQQESTGGRGSRRGDPREITPSPAAPTPLSYARLDHGLRSPEQPGEDRVCAPVGADVGPGCGTRIAGDT